VEKSVGAEEDHEKSQSRQRCLNLGLSEIWYVYINVSEKTVCPQLQERTATLILHKRQQVSPKCLHL
jgi:hypothetical protein